MSSAVFLITAEFTAALTLFHIDLGPFPIQADGNITYSSSRPVNQRF